MTEMHDVVEMLLNRMKDYPEDFVRSPNHSINEYRSATKWERALGIVYEVAAPHEKDALDIRGEEAKRAVYMGAALAIMMGEDEPVDVKKVFKTGSQLGFGITAPTTNTTTTSVIADLEARIKAQEVQMQRQYALNTYAGNAAGSALG